MRRLSRGGKAVFNGGGRGKETTEWQGERQRYTKHGATVSGTDSEGICTPKGN